MNVVSNIKHHFPALGFKHFRAFFAAQFISLIGTWMQGTTIPYLVKVLTGGNNFMLGLVSALNTLPILLFTLFAGALADRHQKRKIVIATQICLLLQAAAFAVLSVFHALSLGHIIMLGMIGGFFLAFDMPTRQALIREIVDIKALPSAIALNSSIFNAARTIGPAFGGAVLAALGATICFGANAISFIGIILVLIWMRSTSNIAPTGVSSFKSLLDGIKYASLHPGIRGVLALIAVCSLFGWTYVVVLPTVPRDFYGIQSEARQAACFGLLMSASGVGAVVGALGVAFLSRRGLLSKSFVAGWILFIICLAGFAVSTQFWMGLIALCGIGLGLVTFQTAGNSLVQLMVPDKYRGRLMGLYAFLFIGIAPFGSLFVGTLAHFITTRYAFLVNAALCLIAILLSRATILRSAPDGIHTEETTAGRSQ